MNAHKYDLGGLSARQLRARRRALGAVANGPPRFLVRVDEFPYATAFYDPQGSGTAASRRLHETLARAGVPYLMALLAQPEPATNGNGPRRAKESAGRRR